jgi:hypothetical protein
VRNYFAGRSLQREYAGPGIQSGRTSRFVDTFAPYLGGNTGSARLGQLANILGQVGGRAVGRGSSEYFSSGKGPYTSIRSFTDAFRDAARDAQAHPVAGTARQLAINVGRTMDTVAAPLFDHTIPRLKNGAWMERMHDWLERNPSASHDEQLAYGRQLSRLPASSSSTRTAAAPACGWQSGRARSGEQHSPRDALGHGCKPRNDCSPFCFPRAVLECGEVRYYGVGSPILRPLWGAVRERP